MTNDQPDNDALDEMLVRSYAAVREPVPGQRDGVLSGLAERDTSALHALSTDHQQRHLPWWRRSIAIPVPLAAALVLLMAVALYSSFRNWQERPAQPIATPGQGEKGEAAAGIPTLAVAQPKAEAQPRSKHYETETYLCGVGRVSSETYYAIKE
jgi:hypothetical protein